MTREEFRHTFRRLTRARGSQYVTLRELLVAAGGGILPWLAEEEHGDDAGSAFDASTVRTWIEHSAHVRLCDGILDGSIHAPRRPPNTEDGDRVTLLIRVGVILTPRLVEGLVRSREYEGMQAHLAMRVLRAVADPRAQEPLRRAMGDSALTMELRMELATILWDAYQDPRPVAFAESIARDDDTPPGPRGRAIHFLAEREERQVLPLVRALLQRRGLDVGLGVNCVDAIQILGDEESAMLLERILTSRSVVDEIRVGLPLAIGSIRGPAALPVLRHAATEDPSSRVREAAANQVSYLSIIARRAAP